MVYLLDLMRFQFVLNIKMYLYMSVLFIFIQYANVVTNYTVIMLYMPMLIFI